MITNNRAASAAFRSRRLSVRLSFRSAVAGSALALAISLGAATAHSATINVSDDASLSSALSSVNPGDTVVLANGTYSGFTASRHGNSAAPIVIKAANQGQATVASGIIHLASTSYVTVQGLNITSNGGTQTIDGVSRIVVVWLEVADHCQLTRCTVHPSAPAQYTQFVFLSGGSNANRIDHNEFGPNTVHGCHMIWPCGNATIAGVTPPSDRTLWAEGYGPYNPNISRNTRIDHNYFHDQASGTAETIVTGAFGITGDYQDTNTLIEYNLFVNCDGDPEIVSVKSSSNTIRFNTVLTSGGQFSLRAGNNSYVYDNFVRAGAKSGSGGVKVYEKNHTVYNNYIEDTDQYPILIGAGDAYTSSYFAHAQVFNAWIYNNSVVNAANRPVIMGHGSTDNLPPTNVVFANNLIHGTATQLYDERIAPAGASVYAANLVWSSAAGVPATGFTVENPQFATVNTLLKLSSTSPAIGFADMSYAAFLEDDMDGQARDTNADIGADEYSLAAIARAPLTTSDVGPNAPGDGLPPSWKDQDVGSVGLAGSTSFANNTFTVNGSGSDVWGTSDSFHYAYRSTSGDLTLTARVATEQNTSSWAKAGVMVRESTAANAAYVFVMLTPSNGVSMQYRSATGASAASVITVAGPVAPTWLRLVRSGSTFTGYRSADGVTWTLVGSVGVTMASNATAGLALCAHNNAAINTSTFDNVSMPSGTISLEAESLASAAVGGVTESTVTDSSASGGVWVALNANAPEEYLEFATPSISAGTYQLSVRYKAYTSRGQCSVKVDGVVLGNTIDQYSASAAYVTTNVGTVIFPTTGVHTIRLSVLGKNASSSNYILSADSFTWSSQ